MTPADRPSVTDAARTEAERRWGDRRTSDRLPIDWLDEGMASGFVLGAQWAIAQLVRDLDAGEASDGYHTHNELYEYRMLYNAHAAHGWHAAGIPVVKSWRHSDGEQCFGGGWFIVTATLPTGQVSNHYEAEHWDLFQVPAVDLPPEYDGHTPAVAAERLRASLAAARAGATAVTDEDALRGRMDQAVGGVLWNATNHPNPPAVLGKDIGPMRAKVVDAVMDVLATAHTRPTPDHSHD